MDNLFMVPSLQEIVDLMYYLKITKNREYIKATTIPGLYIEIKYPVYYAANGIDMTKELFEFLKKNNLETVQKATDNGIPIIIQSFYESEL